ncbi:MAG: hypothetical protein AAFR27_11115 [Pseudomonadota bacterium]
METKNDTHLSVRHVSRANSESKTKPISIRFTSDELCELKRLAGHLPLSTFVRQRLFGGEGWSESAKRPHLIARLSAQQRQRLLAQILLKLGQLRCVDNVNETLAAIQSGLIEASPEACTSLDALTRELTTIRVELLKALGLRP